MNTAHELEFVFAHGSLEALLRLHYGLVPQAEVEELMRRRIRVEYPDGEYRGLHLILILENGQILFAPAPQVSFARKGEGWAYTLRCDEWKQQRKLASDGPGAN